jgi:hypothetical protein
MMAQPVMLPISTSVTSTKGSTIREKKVIYEGSSSPRELLESIVIQATAAIKGLEGQKPPDQNVDEMTEEQKRVTQGTSKNDDDQSSFSAENLRLLDFCQRIVNTAGVIDRFLQDTKGAQFFERMQASLPRIIPMSSADVQLASGANEEETEKTYVDWASRARWHSSSM